MLEALVPHPAVGHARELVGARGRVELAHQLGALERGGRVMGQGLDQPGRALEVPQDAGPDDGQSAGGATAGDQGLIPGGPRQGRGGGARPGVLDQARAFLDNAQRPRAHLIDERAQLVAGHETLMPAQGHPVGLELPQQHGDRPRGPRRHRADDAAGLLGILDVGQQPADLGEDLEVRYVGRQAALARGLALLAGRHERALQVGAGACEGIGADADLGPGAVGRADAQRLIAHRLATQGAGERVTAVRDSVGGLLSQREGRDGERPRRRGVGAPQPQSGWIGVQQPSRGIAGDDGAFQRVEKRPGARVSGRCGASCLAGRGVHDGVIGSLTPQLKRMGRSSV